MCTGREGLPPTGRFPLNVKKPYKSPTGEPKPEFLHEVQVRSGSKTYTLTKGQLVSVGRRTGLIAGKYEFVYAEYTKRGELLLYVDGPTTRETRRKMIRESDIKTVHIRTGAR